MAKMFSATLNKALLLTACVSLHTPAQASEAEISSVAKEIVAKGGTVLNCTFSESCDRGECSSMDAKVEIALTALAETALYFEATEAVPIKGTWIEPVRHSGVDGVQLGRVTTVIATGFGDSVLVASVDLNTLEINSSEHLSTAFGTSHQYGSCEVVN